MICQWKRVSRFHCAQVAGSRELVIKLVFRINYGCIHGVADIWFWAFSRGLSKRCWERKEMLLVKGRLLSLIGLQCGGWTWLRYRIQSPVGEDNHGKI